MKWFVSFVLVAGLLAGCGDDKSETPVDANETKGAPSNVGPTEGEPFTIPGLAMEMLWCKPGTFTMGSPESEAGWHLQVGETPRKVTLTKGFWLGQHEVTQAQWQAIMGSNPSNFKGANLPVENVLWNDAVSFCPKLTERERKAGRLPEGWEYAPPTEAQWEYACRAGTTTTYPWGDRIKENQANFNDNIDKTTPVGSYAANPWGFHDMPGNVWEWTADWYQTVRTSGGTRKVEAEPGPNERAEPRPIAIDRKFPSG